MEQKELVCISQMRQKFDKLLKSGGYTGKKDYTYYNFYYIVCALVRHVLKLFLAHLFCVYKK